MLCGNVHGLWVVQAFRGGKRVAASRGISYPALRVPMADLWGYSDLRLHILSQLLHSPARRSRALLNIARMLSQAVNERLARELDTYREQHATVRLHCCALAFLLRSAVGH